jgi:hypothetical protein
VKRPPLRSLAGTLATVVVTAAVTTTVVSQPDDHPAAAQAAARMAAWMELGEPGPEHRRMAELEGVWDQTISHTMYPGAEPRVSNAVATIEPIFGGRYLLQRYEGAFEIGDQKIPFEGMGIMGYDRLEEEHFLVWIDSMSTMTMVVRGTASDDGDTVTYLGEMTDPVTGKPMGLKSVHRRMPDGSMRMEWYEKLGPRESDWFMNSRVVATRR